MQEWQNKTSIAVTVWRRNKHVCELTLQRQKRCHLMTLVKAIHVC